MTFARTSLAVLVAVGGLIFGSSTTEAASSHHIDAYALRLQGQANSLMRELKYHYRHAPLFGHLMADARSIKRDVGHVHEVAHYGRDLKHLQADLRELDRAIHHLDELMKEVEYHVRDCHDPRCGHFHGDTRSARRLVNRMLDTLHHLQEDVRTALHRPRRGHRTGHGYGIGHGSGRGYGYRPAGRNGSYNVTFGNHGWTVRLGSWF